MQTRFPDQHQIDHIRHETMNWLNSRPPIAPALADFICVLHSVPGFAVQYLPGPDSIFRVYCTEAYNIHMINIHLTILNRLEHVYGRYDWLAPGACVFSMNYFLKQGSTDQIWLPTWEARVGTIESSPASMAVSQAWGDGIYDYLRANRFIN